MWSWPANGDSVRVWAINPDAWGFDNVVVGASMYQPILFPGQYQDVETAAYENDENGTVTVHRPGIVLNGHRSYDPFVGSYLQVDPMADQTRTSYVYAGGDPVNAVDPSGLDYNDPKLSITCDMYDNCSNTSSIFNDGFWDGVWSAVGSFFSCPGCSNDDWGANPLGYLDWTSGVAPGASWGPAPSGGSQGGGDLIGDAGGGGGTGTLGAGHTRHTSGGGGTITLGFPFSVTVPTFSLPSWLNTAVSIGIGVITSTGALQSMGQTCSDIWTPKLEECYTVASINKWDIPECVAWVNEQYVECWTAAAEGYEMIQGAP